MKLTRKDKCVVCNSAGSEAYENLVDRQFGVAGEWSLSQCSKPDCGTLWLNPRPIDEDLPETYANYYTRGKETRKNKSKRWKLPKRITRLFESLIGRMIGIKKARLSIESMYTNTLPVGKVLEVGCGNGSRLTALRKNGWDAIGQDVDEEAVKYAKSKGEKVILGSLDQIDCPENSFDAVVSNHVFEHVSNPLQFLADCKRLMKPNGRLVVITPNPSSIGRQKWGEHWYCLDPPRHLHLFSPEGAKELARQAGFSDIESYSSSAKANWVANGSIGIQEYGKPWTHDSWWKQIRSLVFLYRSWLNPSAHKNKGEETILIARKPE